MFKYIQEMRMAIVIYLIDNAIVLTRLSKTEQRFVFLSFTVYALDH